jgi:hypothetical protein
VSSATTAIAACQLCPNPATAAPQAKELQIDTVSLQPTLYHGWPTVARRKNGELLLVCSGGREAHVCPFGRVELMTSPDGGQTWSFPRTLLDSAIDDRDAGVLETAKGTLLVTTFTSLAYEPVLKSGSESGNWNAEKLARWQGVQRRTTPEQRRADLGVWMIRSTDDGLSWSPRYDVPVNSPHGPIQLQDGRLLYPGKDLWRSGTKVGVCESKDDGLSWQWLAEISPRQGDKATEYHELHGVETTKGKLIVHIRNHNPQHAGETLQTESDDGGKTWTAPHTIGVWGLPSHLLRLKDGRLLMSYGYRRPPFGNQARVSEDEGRTWSEAITLSSDGMGGDLGYPSTVELDDGSLVTVWYEVRRDAPAAVLRQARWKL